MIGRQPRLVVGLVVWLFAVAGVLARADEKPLPGYLPESSTASQAAPADPEKLLREGDRLADRKDYAGALLRYKQAYEQIVAEIRGLPFQEEVNPQLMSREELQKFMQELVAEEMPEEKMILLDRGLKAFGFIPASMSVKGTLLNLYTEEVAGFYHPKSKKMCLIKEADERQPRGLLEMLFGPPAAFDKDQQKVALAHEMAHALADQHFDLQALDEAVKDDDDMSLALAALVEGEATLVMMAEVMRQDGQAEAALQLSPQMVDLLFGIVRGFLPMAGGPSLRQAPAIFRESLIFPYLKGMVFILHLTNRGGWEPVNQAFRDPPASTEQILHPEKYRQPRDIPMEVVLPELRESIDPSWKKLGENVLGEFQISVLFGPPAGFRAAAGWDGDRYAVFEQAPDQLALVWVSTWDSAEEAHEFAEQYVAYVKKRLGVAEKEGQEDKGAKEQRSNRLSAAQKDRREQREPVNFRLALDGRVHVVRQQEADVIVIEGFSEAETDRLLERLSQVQKRPKRFPLGGSEAADR